MHDACWISDYSEVFELMVKEVILIIVFPELLCRYDLIPYKYTY